MNVPLVGEMVFNTVLSATVTPTSMYYFKVGKAYQLLPPEAASDPTFGLLGSVRIKPHLHAVPKIITMPVRTVGAMVETVGVKASVDNVIYHRTKEKNASFFIMLDKRKVVFVLDYDDGRSTVRTFSTETVPSHTFLSFRYFIFFAALTNGGRLLEIYRTMWTDIYRPPDEWTVELPGSLRSFAHSQLQRFILSFVNEKDGSGALVLLSSRPELVTVADGFFMSDHHVRVPKLGEKDGTIEFLSFERFDKPNMVIVKSEVWKMRGDDLVKVNDNVIVSGKARWWIDRESVFAVPKQGHVFIAIDGRRFLIFDEERRRVVVKSAKNVGHINTPRTMVEPTVRIK